MFQCILVLLFTAASSLSKRTIGLVKPVSTYGVVCFPGHQGKPPESSHVSDHKSRQYHCCHCYTLELKLCFFLNLGTPWLILNLLSGMIYPSSETGKMCWFPMVSSSVSQLQDWNSESWMSHRIRMMVHAYVVTQRWHKRYPVNAPSIKLGCLPPL